jgi:hypothetical protein
MTVKQDVINKVAIEASGFIKRRATKISEEIGSFLNINPFLLAAISDMHEIKDQRSLTEFLLAAHLATGHSTSFGKMIDEKLLPNVFGTQKLDAKFRRESHFSDTIYDDIDHIVKRGDSKEYLLSLKAGAWTIQHGQAMQLYHNFKDFGDRDLARDGIVIGVFYGNETLLTNKYDIVQGINRRHQESMTRLGYVQVKAGKAFWSWINDDQEETQDWVMEGIKLGCEQYLESDKGVAELFRNAPAKLEAELQEKYALDKDGSLDWIHLLHAVNDLPANLDPRTVIERKEMIEESGEA